MIAKISYFYSMSPIDVLKLPNEGVDKLWECITMIEAQEQLKAFQVQDWPNMKKQTRAKTHRDLFKKAYPKKKQSIPTNLKQEDIVRMLGVF